MLGKHLILDVHNIQEVELLFYSDIIRKLMNEIVQVGNLNVLAVSEHQFDPVGTTIIYLLAESHLSIHTYPEIKYAAIDLYCCNPNIDFDSVIQAVEKFFNYKCWCCKKILNRS